MNERSEAARLLGSKGGKKVVKTRGKGYMAKIAAKGGQAMKERGPEYYSKLGKLSAEARKKKALEKKRKAK